HVRVVRDQCQLVFCDSRTGPRGHSAPHISAPHIGKVAEGSSRRMKASRRSHRCSLIDQHHKPCEQKASLSIIEVHRDRSGRRDELSIPETTRSRPVRLRGHVNGNYEGFLPCTPWKRRCRKS